MFKDSLTLGGRSIREALRTPDSLVPSIFIPVFFVYSGMTLNIDAIVANPLPLVVFLVFLLLIRGVELVTIFVAIGLAATGVETQVRAVQTLVVAIAGSTIIGLVVGAAGAGRGRDRSGAPRAARGRGAHQRDR